jgi:DNA-binding response OmpR family regulator
VIDESTAPTGERVRVLVTDDHPALRQAVRNALQSEGFDAEDAADGRRALELLRENEFDVLVTDVRMPGMDGYQLLEQVQREQMRTRTVMFSVFADESSRRHAAGLGVVAFLQKPFALDELVAAIRSAVQ